MAPVVNPAPAQTASASTVARIALRNKIQTEEQKNNYYFANMILVHSFKPETFSNFQSFHIKNEKNKII